MLSPNNDSMMQRPAALLGEVLRITMPILILALGIVGFWILSNQRAVPATDTQAAPRPLVETEAVRAYEQDVDIDVDGLVVPYREIHISAEVVGRVKYKADICRAGNYVTEGTLLIEIDPVDYLLEVRRLTKEWEQAKVILRELDVEVANTQELIKLAEENLMLQRRELRRLRGLSGDRFVSESKVDEAARAELTARNSLQTLESQLRLYKTRRSRLVQAQELVATRLEIAELDRKRTKVFAPTDGVIVADMVEQDSYVQKGESLLSLEDTSLVEVKCNLRMQELYWVLQQSVAGGKQSDGTEMVAGYQLPSTPVTVLYRLGGREFVWDGRLSRYDGIGLDEKTRTVPCRVVVEHPWDAHLRDAPGSRAASTGRLALVRGMYVTVILHTRPQRTFLRIPERAVQPGNFVWLVEDGKLRRQDIQVSQWLRDGALVDANQVGFRAGARLVVSPLANVQDGIAVQEKQSL